MPIFGMADSHARIPVNFVVSHSMPVDVEGLTIPVAIAACVRVTLTKAIGVLYWLLVKTV